MGLTSTPFKDSPDQSKAECRKWVENGRYLFAIQRNDPYSGSLHLLQAARA